MIEESFYLLETRCFGEAYTGLPVVRVTENQKALNCVVLKYNILSKSRYNVDLILVMYYISAGQT